MADQLRLRGGPTAESEVFVGAEREVTVDTGLKALRIHDGVTPGGHLVELSAAAIAARAAAAASDAQARALLQSALDNAIATLTTADTSTLSIAQTYADNILTSANSYTDTAVSNLIDGSPDLLNTLNEIAAAINDDANFFSTLNTSISALQADVDQNEADSDAALLAEINARIDADDVQAIQLAGEANLRATNDNALSARIATLEADPTTATALANQLTTVQGLISAVQTDVDLNEADADAAVAAEEAARIAADGVLTSSVSSEATTRAAADTALQANITAEETSRVADVAALTATINSNEAAHVVAHNGLQNSIDTINTDRSNLEERLLQAGLASGLLYVSIFSGG